MPKVWTDCGCCGRTHEDLAWIDCRSFNACPYCGDCYLYGELTAHKLECDGKALSMRPGAIFAEELPQ